MTKVRLALIAVLGIAACNPAPARAPASEQPVEEQVAPATDMVPISDLANSNQRFAHCKERWRKRLQGEEDTLRAEKRLREVTVASPDFTPDRLRLIEEQAERRRIDMANLYSQTDQYGCFG